MTEIQLLAQFVAERAANSFIAGLLIAGFAWLVLRIVGKQNSGTRFAVWFAALLAVAGLPFVPSLGSAEAVRHAVRPEIVLPKFWAVAIFALWIFFAAVAAARVVVGLWKLRSLRRSGVALVTLTLPPALRETLAECKAIRPVTVCSSSQVSVPAAIGFFKPVILIPEWALRELPVEELKIILLHEFAHLRRWDDWTNLAQKIVRIIFFFHPAVWWIEKRLSLEREMACDDVVLAETGNPHAYAECLVSLAEKSFVQRGLAMAQAAISRACETSMRLARILDVDRPRAIQVFKPALGLMAGLIAVCMVMLPGAPRLIAFANGVQPHSIATASADVPRQAAAGSVAARPDNESATRVVPRNLGVVARAVYCPSISTGRGLDAVDLRRRMSARQERHRAPAFIVPAARQTEAAPQFVVVMQTAEFDERGSVVLSVRVWRVVFTLPHGNAAQQGVIARST